MTSLPLESNSHELPLSLERQRQFEEIRTEISRRLVLREVSSSALEGSGCTCHAWDAIALPTESHYVPVFLSIIEQQEHVGSISPDTHILVETTTGNAGAAVAWLARKLGYEVIIFMPEDMPDARIEDVRKHLPETGCAELRLTPAKRYVEGMVEVFRQFLARHKKGYQGKKLAILNHSRRSESVEAIEDVISALLARNDSFTPFDTAIVALGNGTTASGIARALRKANSETRIIGVEPMEAPWIFVQKFGEAEFLERYGPIREDHNHQLLGSGGWGVKFPNFDLALIDDIIPLQQDAWQTKQRQLQGDGLAVGNTSAACLAVVDLLAKTSTAGTHFFTVMYDPITKY
ncbi:MAG: pyridoxal-phosphate dependent enzyme [Planctomycetota bacterium]|nr:MAG: pyridoxal-phosphate dependent enzyme [Planctomycetota bacterium]